MLSVFWEQPYTRVSHADLLTPIEISDDVYRVSFCNFQYLKILLSHTRARARAHTHTHTHTQANCTL